MNPNRLTMPVLHKHTASKVKKTVSPVNMRTHENSALNAWPYQDPFPSWSSGDMSAFGGDIDLHMSSYQPTSFPFEQWGEQYDQSSWTSNVYQPVSLHQFYFISHSHLRCISQSPVEDLFAESNYSLDRQMPTSESFIAQPTYAFPDEIPSNNIPSLPSQPLSLLGKDADSLNGTDYNWTSSWLQGADTSEADERQVEPAMEWSPIPYDLNKNLLKLNLELIESLELVETTCGIMRFSPLIPEDVTSFLSKLDLPIIRVLNHSTQFLEILPATSAADEKLLHLMPSIEFPSMTFDDFQDTEPLPLDSVDGNLEEGPTTASSHDSGYHTVLSARSNSSRLMTMTKCDMPTALSILMTYVQLLRIYRVIFNQIHQLLLVMSPADTASRSSFLLPSLQFGQFQPEGRLGMQLYSVLDMSSDVLCKIERALGISYGPLQDNGDAVSVMSILDSGLLASIRDNVVTQEQIDCGVSIKDTIDRLRRLVSDSFCI